MKKLYVFIGVLLCGGLVSAGQPARTSTPPSAGDVSTQIAAVWSLLAHGRAAQASERARQMLASDPRNGAIIQLAVEAEIGRAGANAGLAQYERSLGRRGLEEPTVLRRIAFAVLREAASQTSNERVRIEALEQLSSAGDQSAGELVDGAPAGKSVAELRARAATGDEEAVAAIVQDLNQGGNALQDLDALAKSGSPSAIDPVAARLRDVRPEIRGAAADALGSLPGPEVTARLKPLLTDRSSFVRVRDAAALYRVGDASGLDILHTLAASGEAGSRLIAAEALAARPDGSWLSLVRDLTDAAEPEVRLGAARLVAPHDPELARRVLNELANDPNLTIRELASEASADVAADDLPGLRQLLKPGTDPLVRVRAAGRILAFTA
jgi:hypothetical protein